MPRSLACAALLARPPLSQPTLHTHHHQQRRIQTPKKNTHTSLPNLPPQESFDPIMDLGSNTDLLPVMLYARRAGEWDYSNCLTLLLRHKVGGVGGGGGVAGGCVWWCNRVGALVVRR